jgi:hypothetical protein
MATTLTGQIKAQDIVSRFSDFVVATANSGISWGTNALPTYNGSTPVVDSSYFGGTNSGKSIGISGANITPTNNRITAQNIYSSLLAETTSYTSIRNLNAKLYITHTPGDPELVYNQTNIAYMSNSYLQPVSVSAGQVSSDNNITVSGLEGLMINLQSAYNTARSVTVNITTTICHVSCHNSCHSSSGLLGFSLFC